MSNGCILCGRVGTGKSRTSLAYYYLNNGGALNTDIYYQMDDPPQDLYIITTARKRDTLEWEQEMIPFYLSTNPEVNLYSNKVVVDSWNNIGKYVDVEKAFFIFDEQRVVGSGAWVKSFLKIAKKNDWILLSATPGDKWEDYIPVFIANGFYKNRSEFNRDHVVYKPFTTFPIVDRYLGEGKLLRLRRQILVKMDQSKTKEFKREVTRQHEDIFVPYDMKVYKETNKLRWNPYKNEPIVNASELCFTLRKIVNSDPSRIQEILCLIRQHPKVIIFYNFDYELEILRNADYGSDVLVAEWNGHKHEPIPKSDKWVYLVHYASGAEGWNCIETDTIIFYSQSYSYKTMVQAAGRIDRVNSPFRTLYFYHLRSRSGIDLAITRALKAKKNFNENSFVRGIK